MKTLAVVFALMAVGLCAEPELPNITQWRLSNALGLDLGPAPLTKQPRKLGWTLRIETRAQSEERVLFQDGQEQSTKLIDSDAAGRVLRVRDLRAGEPVWEVAYRAETGLPSAETSFDAGEPAQTAELTFEGRTLVKRVVKDSSGTLLYTDTLFRWPDGSLRRVERDSPDGPLAEAAWSYGAAGRLTGAWTASESDKAQGRHHEWTYAPGATSDTLASETQTLLTRVSEEGDSGGKATLTDAASGRVATTTTDTQGRLTGEMITVKDALIQVRHWTYDSQGRVTEASTESAGPPESWTYTYETDGSVTAKLLRAGVLVKEVVSLGGETTSVSLYDRGGLFLVETWAQGRRVKETYYQNGKITRERTP